MSTHHRVVIIGSGFGGIAMAHHLKRAGIDDFVILERAAELGGTWQANTYPGAQCDIPSILYSFSFAPNPRWTRLYPLQAEIKAYLEDCADRFDIRRHISFEDEMLDSSWDEERQVWDIRSTRGTSTASVLVGAMGPFSEPAVPNFPGLERFRGTTFHSTNWDHDHDLRGERVAVVGTGASAVQFIPRIAPLASHLTVFQRTPTWILPHPDRPVGRRVQRLFETSSRTLKATRQAMNAAIEGMVPGLVYQPRLLKGLERVGLWHLRRQVSDPALRAKLTPHFGFGCKRPTFSNAYYPALARPDVDVVTQAIAEVTENGVRTADGAEHHVDTIIFGTGFKLADNTAFRRIHGREGHSLHDQWGGDMTAHLGTTITGFPNFYMLLGPNSVVYTSQVVTIEAQVAYVMAALRAMDREKLSTLEVTPRTQQEFVRWVDHGLRNSVWNTGGCTSYYLSPTGRNFTFWPGFNDSFRRRTSKIDLSEYRTRSADAPTPEPAGAAR